MVTSLKIEQEMCAHGLNTRDFSVGDASTRDLVEVDKESVTDCGLCVVTTGGHLEPQCPNDSTSMHWTHRVPTGLCDPCCDYPQPCGMNRQHTPAVSSETKLNKS